jgi:hypothetical protein
VRLGVEQGIAAPPLFKVSARCAAPVCGINTALPMPARSCRAEPGDRSARNGVSMLPTWRADSRASCNGGPFRSGAPRRWHLVRDPARTSRCDEPTSFVQGSSWHSPNGATRPRWFVGTVDVGTVRHDGTAAAAVSSIMPAQVAIEDESTAIPARNLAVVIEIRCPVWPRPHHPHITAFPSGQRRDKPERRKPSRSTSNRHSRDAGRPTRLLTPAASPQTCRLFTPSNRERSERELPFSP